MNGEIESWAVYLEDREQIERHMPGMSRNKSEASVYEDKIRSYTSEGVQKMLERGCQ
ncbi:hypothetical protein PCCS19_11710 [Paenibacillus sp. CCS19]|nr:hypothetical protein PCCS19_11710 [Paenibacillus cellulosilyticus]